MLVSIIICNLNYARYLPDALDSVANQSYKEIELLLIDDGSSDNSKSVLESFRSDFKERFTPIRLHLYNENQGKLSRLNKHIPELSGELSLILDSDDFLDESFLTVSIHELIKQNTGFVYTQCFLVNELGEKLVDGKNGYPLIGKSCDWDRELLYTASYIPECGLTRTEALKQAVPFDEKIKIGTKHHKWNKIAMAGWTGCYIPKPLFSYRMHDRNLSGIGRHILGNQSPISENVILSGYWKTRPTR